MGGDILALAVWSFLWLAGSSRDVPRGMLALNDLEFIFSVDILAQGKIQNSHSPFYSMFHNIELCSLKSNLI